MIIDYIKVHLPSVLTEANNRLKVFKSVVHYNHLSTKLRSEIISNILEATFSDIVPNIRSPFTDGEPDLWVGDVPLEIKTAKTVGVWRGGEYSKRESDYLLVSYDDSGEDMKWFVFFVNLKKGDWVSSGSTSYYATTIELDQVLGRGEILVGSVVKKRVKNHLVCG